MSFPRRSRVGRSPPRRGDGDIVDTITWVATGPGLVGEDSVELPVAVGPLPEVESLTFPTVQTYDDGEVVRWIEPAPPGEPEPELPIPTLEITPASPEATTAPTEPPTTDAPTPTEAPTEAPATPPTEAAAPATAAVTAPPTDTATVTEATEISTSSTAVEAEDDDSSTVWWVVAGIIGLVVVVVVGGTMIAGGGAHPADIVCTAARSDGFVGRRDHRRGHARPRAHCLRPCRVACQ